MIEKHDIITNSDLEIRLRFFILAKITQREVSLIPFKFPF